MTLDSVNAAQRQETFEPESGLTRPSATYLRKGPLSRRAVRREEHRDETRPNREHCAATPRAHSPHEPVMSADHSQERYSGREVAPRWPDSLLRARNYRGHVSHDAFEPRSRSRSGQEREPGDVVQAGRLPPSFIVSMHGRAPGRMKMGETRSVRAEVVVLFGRFEAAHSGTREPGWYPGLCCEHANQILNVLAPRGRVRVLDRKGAGDETGA